MTEHHRGGLHAQRVQGEPCAEGDMVDHHAVRRHLADDLPEPIEHTVGVEQQVVPSGIGLVPQGGDRPETRRVEERAQVLVLARRVARPPR